VPDMAGCGFDPRTEKSAWGLSPMCSKPFRSASMFEVPLGSSSVKLWVFTPGDLTSGWNYLSTAPVEQFSGRPHSPGGGPTDVEVYWLGTAFAAYSAAT
jgi:hypothetical protein